MLIPSRRISPIFGAAPQVTDPFIRPVNDENSPRTLERRTLYGEELPPNPANILQEVHNSTRRRRISPRPGFGAIFQDSGATMHTSGETGLSWHNETTSNRSPSPANTMPIKMLKLRERSGNENPPAPLSSPLGRQVKSRKGNPSNVRSTSSEAAKYIEHLEGQLTAVNTKLDSLMSPTVNKARTTKVKALTVESRSLRQEVSDWETRFAERVKEEVDQRMGLETGMRSRLQLLEDEMEMKDVKMRELEWELDSMRAKVKEAEGLEEVNLNLEKRIDVLTSLLVQSPTKLELCSAASSPGKGDPMKRGPRPISMLPGLPSSPGGVRLSLNTNAEASFWSSQRFASTSNVSEPLIEINRLTEADEKDDSAECHAGATQDGFTPGASVSFRSIPSCPTRPTSIQSDSSFALRSPGGLSVSIESECQTKSANRPRKMRRFPSGSCALKPLILPKTAVTLSLPASAPIHTSPGLSQRDFSCASLDPTTAFLSKYDFSSPLSTPTSSCRQRSATWTQQQTLRALEGKLTHIDRFSEASIRYSPAAFSEDHFEPREETQTPKRRRPLSLEKELEIANMLSPNHFEDGLIPVMEDEGDDETLAGSSDPAQTAPDLPNIFLSQEGLSTESDDTPKAGRQHDCAESPSRPMPSTAMASGGAYGIISRLTSLMSRVKQDPVVLAHRLLHNAWTLGSTRLGGIGWWLIGLVFGSYRQARECAADGTTVEENPPTGFNWPYFSPSASRMRTAEHYLSDHGGGTYADAHEFPQRQPFRRWSPGHAPDVDVTMSSAPRVEPHLFPCHECEEPSSRRTCRLWFHFSLAIVLAVGVAIKHGPGSLLVDTICPLMHDVPHRQPEAESRRKSCPIKHCGPSPGIKRPQPYKDSGAAACVEEPGFAANGDVVFAEILGPSDFEHSA